MSPPLAGTVHSASTDAWRHHLGQETEVTPTSLRQWLTSGTIPLVAERSLHSRGRSVLLDIDGSQATGDQLLAASNDRADALSRSGAIKGSRVLLSIPTSLDFVAAYLGTLRSGCSVILTNPTLTGPELDRLLETSQPTHGIVSPRVHELLHDQIEARSFQRLTSLSVLVRFRNGVPPHALRDISANGSIPVSTGDEALIAFTSGSTGEPKGVPLTHANLLSSMRAVMASWRWGPDDIVVHSLPLYHQHGLGTIHALALGGGHTVIRSRFDPDELASVVSSEHASVLFGVPAMYQRVVEASPNHETFASLRLLVSGSAPLAPMLFDQIVDLTGRVPLERYGLTESGLDVSNPYAGLRRPGSVGYALPGVEVCVATEGKEVPVDTDGEILLRGPQVFSGYVGSGATHESTFAPGGWFRTGDIGRVDPDDGSLSITGRSKDLIISGGMNVYPREIELVLEQHPTVAAVAIGGVASRRWGEEVCAFIVARPGSRPRREELALLCQNGLAPYKHPKQFVLVEDLPRNEMGKILRSELPPLLRSGEELN